MSADDDVMRSALRGLRRDSLRAQRRREPALMVSIGLAEPEDGEDDETEPAGSAERQRNSNWTKSIEKNDTPEERRRVAGMMRRHTRE